LLLPLLLLLLLALSPTAVSTPFAVDNGLEYSPDEIVVSNGAKQAIWQVRCHIVMLLGVQGLIYLSTSQETLPPLPYLHVVGAMRWVH
jgi:hypothetical protein